MPGGGSRRGAGSTHGREDSGEANKDEEACAVCVLGGVTAEQHFLTLELQEQQAVRDNSPRSPLASGSCKGKGEYLLPKQKHRGEVGISSLPAVGIPCCAQPPCLRSSRGFLLLAGRICNV